MSKLKKIVSSVTIVAFAVWLMGPGAAQALTADELQAQINALLAQLSTLQTQLSQLQGTGGGSGSGNPAACSGITFSRNLSQGATGNDVKCLQALLNQSSDTQVSSSGAGSPGSETTYFGPKTKAASVKFQEKYAADVLTPLGLTAGTGFVGAKTTAKLNSILAVGGSGGSGDGDGDGDGDGGGGGTTAGENKVSLAADTPAAATIAKGAQNVLFSKMNFCAAAEANTISQLIFSRTGIAQDADISNVKLYEGITQVGSTQAVNSTTHKVAFASLNWTIPANSCKTLSLRASIANGATAGDAPKLEVSSAADITSTVALSGVFPVQSNAMTIAGIAVGALNVATTTPSGTVVAGGKDQGVAGIIFTASSSEGLKINSLKITEVGSSVNEDVSNIKLFYQSTQLGSTVTALDSGGAAIFDLTAAPLEILAGTSKTLTVYVDVGQATGIKDRTIQFEITDKNNISAFGTNSGGSIIAWGGSGNWNSDSDIWPQKAASITINLGSLTVAQDTAYSPSSQDYTRGTDQNNVIAFKFTAGANEDVRITSLKLRSASGSGLADSSVANVTLYDAATGERLKDTAGNTIAAAGLSSAFVTFGSYTTGLDAVGLFDIPKSTNKSIMVKVDVPQGAATATNVLGLEINNPTTQVWADGIESKNDIPAASINAGATTKVPSTVLMHNIIEKGTLTVVANSGTPAAANFAVGTTAFNIAKFDLTSTGEEINVTQFNVLFSTSSNATTSLADAADLNNIKLYDGSTLLATDAQLSSSYAEFAINLTVPKNGTKTLTVVVDIPTGSDANQLQAWLEKAGNITATGKSSNVTITATAASWTLVRGNVMTKGAPTVTVRAATTPATQTYIQNSTGVEVLKILLTATPTEDIKITRIQIAVDATSTATSTASTATSTFQVADSSGAATGLGGSSELVKNFFGNVKLHDDDSLQTQIGNTVPSLTDGTLYDYADFTGLSLTIPKGTTKVITVKVDVSKGTTTTGTVPAFFFGIATTTAATVDIAGTGVQSGTAATFSMQTGGIGGQAMYFGTAGSLVVANDPEMPNSAIQMEGTTATLGKWKFTAANEAIKISTLRFDVKHSVATSGTVIIPEARIWQLATSGVGGAQYAFDWRLDGGATSTCFYRFVHNVKNNATPSDIFINSINSATSTCNATATAGIIAYSATGTTGAVTLYASPAGQLMIMDYPNPYSGGGNASNTVDTLRTGLRYGGSDTTGREVFGRYAGADGSLVAGKVSIWDGAVKKAETSLSGSVAGQVIFNLPSGSEIEIPKGSKTLTLKADISDYLGAIEGSTIVFSIGTSTVVNASDTDYITAQGASSGSALGAGSITMDAELSGNEQWIYAVYPKVTLNSSSPSGLKVGATSQELFHFDVQNINTSLDVDINAIRFTLQTNASSAIFDKAFNLYKSTDLNTSIGAAVSWAAATSSDTTGYVTLYPISGNKIGAGSTVTYVLKGNTSNMNESNSRNETLTVSIEDGDLFWDDSSGALAGLAAGNANQKTPSLPVTGGTLTY